MPHLILEYSGNVDAPAKLTDLFARLHELLARTGGVKIDNCKSRARVAHDFLVATGDRARGFVHLDIRFLEGRTLEVKQAIGAQARDMLREWFRDSAQALELQITVEIRDIRRSCYFKYPEGTLTPL